ncbi:MAG: hypothetical protein M1479_03235 [Actinobacteria bacterium]|nr:hypothetical protein [Cyanobacteriota bacterium]MCL5771270.1 hypothetical protein [Actinomycetota bacterium]
MKNFNKYKKNYKKNILNYKFNKLIQSRGSIAVVVLIIGIVVLLAVSTLSSFMIRDVKFTKMDEQKLQALNIAEAGISNMYLNLNKFYGENIPLPASPYTGNLVDGDKIIGSYTVSYEKYYNNNEFAGYIITSLGVDKSGVERKIKVKLSVSTSSSSNIFDYIYTGETITFGSNGNVIDGPFYTEGDLNLGGSAGMVQIYNTGPIFIEGNLNMSGDANNISSGSLNIGGNVLMDGSANIKGGPVNIAGSLTMSGASLIGNPLISPMIVMGDINMSGSSQIGMPGQDLVLSCQGTVTNPPWAPIYAVRDDTLTFTYNDPNYNVVDLINKYISNVQSSALIINGDLLLADGVTYSKSFGTNSLSFTKDISGKCVLEIHGNVIINGNLTIGKEQWWPLASNITYYTGKGIIYTTGNINTLTKFIPLNISDFPENTLLTLISNGNITFDIFNFDYDKPDCQNPDIYIVAVAKKDITVEKGTVKGTLIAGGYLYPNKDFSKICYQKDISKYLPFELSSGSSGSGNLTFTQIGWNEIAP